MHRPANRTAPSRQREGVFLHGAAKTMRPPKVIGGLAGAEGGGDRIAGDEPEQAAPGRTAHSSCVRQIEETEEPRLMPIAVAGGVELDEDWKDGRERQRPLN